MHAEIADRKEEIAGTCRRRVSRLEVFGSATRGADPAGAPQEAHGSGQGSPDRSGKGGGRDEEEAVEASDDHAEMEKEYNMPNAPIKQIHQALFAR